MPLTLSGTGTLVLTGLDSYSAGTTVTSGTLDFDGPASLPGLGIMTITGTNSEVVLDDLVTAAPAAADSEPAAAAAPAVDTGATSIGGGISTLLARIRAARDAGSAGGGAVGAVGAGAPAASPAAVPEPSTFAILAAGAIGLIGWARRRHRQRR